MDKIFSKTIEDILNLTEDELKEIVIAIRKLIMEIDPNACELIRIGDKAATYGLGSKKMSEGYCHIIPHKSWVNLGFHQGAHLNDSKHLLEGTGKNMRHIKFRSISEIDQPEIRSLIEVAIAERKEYLKS